MHRIKQAFLFLSYCLLMAPVFPLFGLVGAIRILRGKATASVGPDWSFNYTNTQPK